MLSRENIASKNYLFIVGSPRSGTTWIQTLLGHHPNVATSVELTIFSEYVGSWKKSYERESEILTKKKWTAGLPYLLDKEQFNEQLKRFVFDCYGKLLKDKPDATHVLDKHGEYSYHIESIKDIIPQAKFIHVLRDGRDMALSYLAVKNKDGFFGSKNVLGGAERWKRNVLAARKAKAFGPDKFYEVKYEDMLADGASELKKLYEFCQLPYTDELINRVLEANSFDKMKKNQTAPDRKGAWSKIHFNKGKANVWEEGMSSYDRYIFNHVAGPLLEECGYARSGWWKTTLNSITGPIRFFLVRVRFRLKLASAALFKGQRK